MSPLAFLAVLATLAVVAQGSTKDDTHYVAAVVDYFPSIVHSDRDQNMMDNIAALEGFMAEAKKQDVDILVFPEEGLRGLRGLPFHMYIPAAEDQATPCTSPSAFPDAKPLVQLSCLALKYQMYLVVNLNEKAPCLPSQAAACPNRGFFHHNTDVAFDRTGKVVARYRKYNLFGEYGNEPSPAPEYSTFETDFGVRFGMFICFDILFDTPAARLARDMNITDFVFSAAWFSEVPFLTAVQAHSGWAHALDVNLLAAAYNDPTRGATGSGIYRGRHGVLASIMNWRQESTMLVHRVPKASQWDDDEVQPQMDRINPVLNYGSGTDPFDDMQNLTMIQDHLSVYTTELLDRPEAGTRASKRVDLCSNGLCCRFDVTWQGSDTYTLSSGAAGLHAGFSLARDFNKTEAELEFDGHYYRLVAFSGVRDHSGVATTGVQVCALVSCLNKELASCGWTAPRLDTGNIKWSEFLSVSIEADYEKDGTLQFASTQAGPRYDPLPASTYALQSSPVVVRAGEVPKQTVRLDLKQPLFDLRTFAIYGRYFAWDGKTPTTR